VDSAPPRPLLVVDGDNLAHRAYHSMPKSLVGTDGQPINAVVGFTNMLLHLWGAERPRAVFVGWDTLGVPTYRHRLWPTYQGGRQFDDAIVDQLRLLPELCAAFGFGWGKERGFEADDFLAAAAAAEARRGGTSLVLTNDRDSYQIASPSTTILSPKKGIRELARIGPPEVVAHFGVLPEQVPDYKALAGDPSDNIPGARGIGPKAAAALLLKHGTLDGVLEAWAATGTRLDERDRLLRFRDVARIRTDVAVVLPPSAPPNWAEGAAYVRSRGAPRLAERVERLGQESQATLV